MIVAQDRQMAIDLIEEAVMAGARRHTACAVLEITVRTLQRWQKALQDENTLADQRKAAAAGRTPANKLSEEERGEILRISNSAEFRSLPPSQIVPRLADEGTYVASESSFSKVVCKATLWKRRIFSGADPLPRTIAAFWAFISMLSLRAMASAMSILDAKKR